MCGRYGFVGTADELAEDFPGLQIVDPAVTGYNLSPGRRLSVVIPENSGLRLRSLSWGLCPERIPRPMINVRAEGISRHRLFGPLFAERRCLIPASFFFEWLDDSEPRQPYVARSAAQGTTLRPSQLRTDLAGIQLDGTFAVLTTKATGRLAEIHGRMPIVLGGPAARSWLDASLRDAALLRESVAPLRERALEVYAVSSAVNVARADGAMLLDPLPSTRQLRERERDRRH